MNSGTHNVPHTAQSLGHEKTPALSRDRVKFERCSPWSTAFPPPPPPSTGPLCSVGSQVLRRGQTSPGRTRPSCGLGLHGPVWIVRPRHPGDLPVLVHVVSQRARGLRLRRTDKPLAKYRSLSCCLPLIRRESASWNNDFSKLNTRPADTSVYASNATSR